MRAFEIGFKFQTPSTKENILSRDFFFLGGGGGEGGGAKNSYCFFFHSKLKISGIFKKSVLDCKDGTVRLSKHFCNEKQQ